VGALRDLEAQASGSEAPDEASDPDREEDEE